MERVYLCWTDEKRKCAPSNKGKNVIMKIQNCTKLEKKKEKERKKRNWWNRKLYSKLGCIFY